MKPILTMAAVGAVGFVIWKALWLLLIPLFGAVFGFALLAIKIALFALIAWALWRLFFHRKSESTTTV